MNDPTGAGIDQKKNVDLYFKKSNSWQGELYGKESDYFARAVQRRLTYSMKMIEDMALPPGSKVLDIGCGSGIYVEQLLKSGFEVTGVDLTEEMLSATRKRLGIGGNDAGKVHLRLGDVENIPLPDNEFDLVICVGVLTYLISDEKAQAEIRRVMKPGAPLLLNLRNVYALTDIDFVFRQKLKAIFRHREPASTHLTCPDYAFPLEWITQERQYFYKAYKLRKYERLMSKAGFRFRRAITYGFEFRRLRKLKIVPARWIDRAELFLERLIRNHNLPYLSYSGWIYSGVFIKE